MIEFCGCENRCAEEDTGYARPNNRGVCQVDRDPNPERLAEDIFIGMTSSERTTALLQGAANMEGRTKELAPDWAMSAIEACLDEIARLCADIEED